MGSGTGGRGSVSGEKGSHFPKSLFQFGGRGEEVGAVECTRSRQ